VKVHLSGELAFYGPGQRSTFEFPIDRAMHIADALRLIGVPSADVAVLSVNGVAERADNPAVIVTNDATVDCYPPTSGG
jgi:hypothetical protein